MDIHNNITGTSTFGIKLRKWLKVEDLFGIIELIKLISIAKGSRTKFKNKVETSVRKAFDAIPSEHLDYLMDSLERYKFESPREEKTVRKILGRMVIKRKFIEKVSKAQLDDSSTSTHTLDTQLVGSRIMKPIIITNLDMDTNKIYNNWKATWTHSGNSNTGEGDDGK